MSGLQVKQEAAVLVALVDLDGEAGLLFNKRSTNLSSHRGQVWNLFLFFYNIFHINKRSAKYLRILIRAIFQVSFPGGKVDEGDLSIVDTALRESEEEIGLLKDQVGYFNSTISNHLNDMIQRKYILQCIFTCITFTGGNMGLDAGTFLQSKGRLQSNTSCRSGWQIYLHISLIQCFVSFWDFEYHANESK